MSKTLDELGGLPLFPPKARTSDPDTSHQAAASVEDSAETQRRSVQYILRTYGPKTADEIDAVLGWRVTTAGRRLPELRALGLADMLPETGATRSGRQAHFWQAVDSPTIED